MAHYKCKKCNKAFKLKSDYTRHINRKTPCKKNTLHKSSFECSKCSKNYSSKYSLKRHINSYCKGKIPTSDNVKKLHANSIEGYQNHGMCNDPHIKIDKMIDNKYQCKYCMKDFTRSDSVKRHIDNSCPMYNLKNESYQQLIKELGQLKKEFVDLQNKNKILEGSNIIGGNVNITNNTNNTNIKNEIHNEIKIIAFGKEDLYSLLTDEQVKKYFNKGYQSVYHLINDIHFDPNKPEMHNIYISNMADPYAHKFDGEKWIKVQKVDIIEQLFDDKASYLDGMFKALRSSLNPKVVVKFSKFNNEIDDEIIDNLKQEIKLLLYNNRNISIKTRNQE